MEVRILGCSGGVGVDLRTTTIMIDKDILIDAGTGVGDLSMAEMSRIRHIFLTHSHLDHLASIPFLVDTLFDRIREPITIHGQQHTIDALRAHIFNNVIWPDFTKIPNAHTQVLQYQVMQPGEKWSLAGRHVEMISVNHIVPGVGYRVENDVSVFAFSGDTTTNDTFWEHLNRYDKLDLLIVETAFTNAEIGLCRQAGHYCASLLAEDLRKLKHTPRIYISHNKPGFEQQIVAECVEAIKDREVHSLSGGTRFQL